MKPVLYLFPFILVLSSCSQSPEFVVHDQVLEWPVIDEVTDISSQLTYHSGTYFLAGEKSLFSVSDTNPKTKATLVYRFDDSLWNHYSQLWFPGKSLKKPEEINHDFFKGMSPFYIDNLEAVDSVTLLIFVKFNIIEKFIDKPGSALNSRFLVYLYDISSNQLTSMSNDGSFEYVQNEYRINCYLTDYLPLKISRQNNTIEFYSSACYHHLKDSNYQDFSSELIRYRLNQKEPEYYLLDTMKETQRDYEQLMVKDSSLIGIDGSGLHHFMKLDTLVTRGMKPTNAIYLPNSKYPVLLKVLYKPDGTRDVEISRVIDKKTQQVIWFASGITVFSHDLFSTNTGKLLYFYEAEGQVHQLTISQK